MKLLTIRRTTLLLVVLSLSPAFAQDRSVCLDSTLTFDTSALERIVRDPDGVLADEDRFWEDEPAQKYTTVWAANNGFELDRKKWRNAVSEFAERSETERRDSPLMGVTESILAQRETFLADALPRVCAFLPEDTDTGVPVYFTAFIPPRAFVSGGIIVNVAAPYWNGDPDHILSTLIHEIWHVGYSRLREGRTETPLEHGPLVSMLEQLQNEGTATYVAYEARSRFPAPGEKDFQALDSPDDVTRALSEINELLQRVGVDSEERLAERSWKVGVENRGYYVAGAHMARVIDGVAGRDELIRTITTGPVSFIEAYNTLAPDGRRIEVPDAATIAGRGVEMGFPVTISMIAVVAGLLAVGILVFALRRVTM